MVRAVKNAWAEELLGGRPAPLTLDLRWVDLETPERDGTPYEIKSAVDQSITTEIMMGILRLAEGGRVSAPCPRSLEHLREQVGVLAPSKRDVRQLDIRDQDLGFVSDAINNLTDWDMIEVKEEKDKSIWITATSGQSTHIPENVAGCAMYMMQLARTAAISVRPRNTVKQYYPLTESLKEWEEASKALKGAGPRDLENTIELLKYWGWLREIEDGDDETLYVLTKTVPGSSVVDFIMNDIGKGGVIVPSTLEAVMAASLKGIPIAMGAAAIRSMTNLVGHGVTFGFWRKGRLGELTESLLGAQCEEMVKRYLKDNAYEEERMTELMAAMPEATLWPYVWNWKWIDVILDRDWESKFEEGMIGWDGLMMEETTCLATTLVLLSNGYNNPAETKELVDTLRARRGTGWLAALSVDNATTRECLVGEIGEMQMELERVGKPSKLLSGQVKVEGTPPEPHQGSSHTGVRQAPAAKSPKPSDSPTAHRAAKRISRSVR